MDRQIKFRAWDVHRSQMIYFDNDTMWDTNWLDTSYCMQYTGLKDRNGKEIFEGDIVKCDMSYDSGTLPHMGEVVYVNKVGAFATKNQAGETLLHNHILSSFEVIGNVHSNPELL